jgi:hypothetical protein
MPATHLTDLTREGRGVDASSFDRETEVAALAGPRLWVDVQDREAPR